MTISDVLRRVSHTGTGNASSTYAWTFSVKAASDIKVFIDDTVQSSGFTTTVNANGTGNIVFASAPSSSQKVTITASEMSLARTTDYSTAGTFTAASINTALDDNIRMTQQLKEANSRALTAPKSELGTNSLELPTVTNRKGKTLAFNATTGIPESGPTIADTTSVANSVTNIGTVAGISSAVSTVSGLSSNISTLAGLSSEISTLAAKATELGRLGTSDAVSDMNTLATTDVVSDLNSLATSDFVSDLNEIQAIKANVTSVAGIAANVTSVANNEANVNRYASEYTISSSAPGSPSEGDLWYDSTNNVLKYYSGSTFLSISSQAITFGISNTNGVKIDSTSVADDEYARFTANGLESRSTSEVLSDIGGQSTLTFGISNTNAVKIDSSSVADDEYARFTANGLESRSTSEVLSDIGAATAGASVSVPNDGTVGSVGLATALKISSTGEVTVNNSSSGTAFQPLVIQRDSNSANGGAALAFKMGDSASVTAGHLYARIFGVVEDNTNGAEDGFLRFDTSNSGTAGEHFRIASNGDLTATDTSIGSNSDSRLKENIENYTYDLAKFKQLAPKSFDWKHPAAHGNKTQVRGFLAQDISSVDDYWVSKTSIESDHADADLIAADSDGIRRPYTSKLTAKDCMYVSVIQQILTRLEDAEAEITTLKGGG